VFII
jgi:hypothetical protein